MTVHYRLPWYQQVNGRDTGHVSFPAFVMLALHPCQQAASHLACTRPPDFVASRCLLNGFYARTHFLLDSDRAHPACWVSHVGRCAAAQGLRATSIRRAASICKASCHFSYSIVSFFSRSFSSFSFYFDSLNFFAKTISLTWSSVSKVSISYQ